MVGDDSTTHHGNRFGIVVVVAMVLQLERWYAVAADGGTEVAASQGPACRATVAAVVAADVAALAVGIVAVPVVTAPDLVVEVVRGHGVEAVGIGEPVPVACDLRNRIQQQQQ